MDDLVPIVGRPSEFECRTLVLVGGATHAGYLEAGRVLELGVKDARLTIVPGVAHALPIEDPGRFDIAVLGIHEKL